MNKYNVHCPQCDSEDVESKNSYGGFAVYKQLVCTKCGFNGGTSRVFTGEEERVEREIVERFAINRRDAVQDFVNSIIA
jgi:transposase-like protein